ncbi:class F sortase [Arthrobacter sp. NQ7]|uniref:class F sortase n=1 Tax=Arthrobacter sp. NQ7 TaxID=3032303 RepID=UPI00240F8966|nr:class F sortase [Arthrobacter sp. NQ7]MDJ0457582.1 class F sortase [Arthrobacter sp. NQ7]
MKTGTTPAGTDRRRSPGAAAAVLAAALVLSGCGPAGTAGTAGPAGAGETAPVPPAAGSPAPATAAPSPAGAAAPSPAAVTPPAVPSPAVPSTSAIQIRPATPPPAPRSVPAPTSLSVSGTSISMPVVPAGVSGGGAMEIPDVFDRAAWYKFGPAPGAAEGTAVIAGHIDTTSDRAPFSALKSLAAGTLIRVGREDAPALTYRVVRVELMAKDRFDSGSVFRRHGPHELKLVTCGGRWLDERMDYSDNVIVTAAPA